MKKVFVLWLVCFAVFKLPAQHLVGLNKSQIENEIKASYPSFIIDNSVINKTYKYLKYINRFDEKTLLVFLSDSDICTATKLICDYSDLEEVKTDLNKKYKSVGKDKWNYTRNKKTYQVTLKREEWFFTVFTSIKKK